jgi:hypothetical protein
MSTNACRPEASPLSGHDARRVVESVGQGQLNEDVLARLQGPHRDIRVQPGGQADVHQVHRTVTEHRVQVGGGGEPEVVADPRQLLRRPAENDHLVHVGALRADRGMSLTEPGPQQGDLHDHRLLPRRATRPAPDHAGARRRPPR